MANSVTTEIEFGRLSASGDNENAISIWRKVPVGAHLGEISSGKFENFDFE